jgi:DNA-binding transcriptional LysR family regulator
MNLNHLRAFVALTSVGKDILDDVQRLLSGADEIKQSVRRALKGTLGVLRIGFVASATADIVPRLAVTFRKDPAKERACSSLRSLTYHHLSHHQ